MNSNRSDSARIADLETALAHQQHAYDGLNQVVIAQANIIDALQQQVKKLELSFTNIQSLLPGEDRNLAAEKPPHY